VTPLDVHLVALDVLEAALQAGDVATAVDPMRSDLEVLSRDDLIRVAMAVAAESTLILTPRRDRPRLLDRVQRRRLHVMVDGA
jgi:hypothetical protein